MQPEDPVAVRCTLIAAAGCAPRDVVIRAAPSVPWGEVRAAVRASGIEVPDPAYAGATAVVADRSWVAQGVRSGAVLGPRPTARTATGLLEVAVVEGPWCGLSAALSARPVVIGRGVDCDLRLEDPEVSRRHCAVAVRQGQAEVVDLATTNGTWLAGEPIQPEQRHELRLGQHFRVGSNVLVVQRVSQQSESTEVRVGPRVCPPLPTVDLIPPTPPQPPERRSLPWIVALLPVVAAVLMAVLWRNAMFLGFALLSPVMAIGQWWNDKRSDQRKGLEAAARHTVAVATHEERIRDALAAELALRIRRSPTLVDAERAVHTRSAALWSRRPGDGDRVLWRLGTGAVPARVTLDKVPVSHARAPVALDLAQHRVTGISGPLAQEALDGLLLQLAAWHSPRTLEVVVLSAEPRSDSPWRWLPHTGGPLHPRLVVADPGKQAFTDVIAALRADAELAKAPPRTVLVLLDADRTAVIPAVRDLLADPARRGLTIVASASAASGLPAECTATIELDSSRAGVLQTEQRLGFVPDLPVPSMVRAVCRSLASCRDVTPDGGAAAVPDAVTLRPLLRGAEGIDMVDSLALQRLWQRRPHSTGLTIGTDGGGPVTLDLRRDGPHVLIAGTTGAGKSELLQTFVAALATVNRPDELNFVLVDYKGGSAFAGCADLPHTVGIVTDLDAHLTRRALRSLQAEVRRRERILAEAGAKDLDDYRADPGRPPVPRLVLVIDEFRVLAEELPDFVDGLVRLAAVGRSLGLHLVLATQRPAGVVTADIRANMNLRIALRVRDEGDAQDVVEDAAPARISSATPGRAVLRTGATEPVTLQTARVTTASGEEGSSVEVGVPRGPAIAWHGPATIDDSSDLAALTSACRAATSALQVAPGRSPWLAPLPDLVHPTDLEGVPPRSVTGAERPGIPLALLDLPDDQVRAALHWTPETDGHLAIVGGPRSGRTSALLTIAAGSATHDVHLYAIDASGALGALAQLPLCGAVVDATDIGRAGRVVSWLGEQIRCRQVEFARIGVSTWVELDDAHRARWPRIALLIDGWEAFSEASDELTQGRLGDEVLALLRTAPAAGLYAVLTGGRALTSGRLAASIRATTVLSAEESDLMMVGLRQDQLPEHMPPGRAVVLPNAEECQWISLGTTGAERSAALGAIARNCAAASQPRRFASLPDHVALSELTAPADMLLLGIAGEDPAPMGFDATEPSAVIAGPPGSGRTSVLLTLAHGAGERPVAWVAPGASAGIPDGVMLLPPDDEAAVERWCQEHPNGLVLVDDLDQLFGCPAEDPLLDHLAASRMTGGAVIAAGTSAELATAFRGLAADLKRRRTGVILSPGRHDGEIFGIQLPPQERGGPGRGLLVLRGRVHPLQAALPPAPPAAAKSA
ncbi:FHA domain-containing protein [Calidifontibacter sp. DB0510]|uniref:FHA domain-containing protein n=1 Tax=Metallococcus carri TaxID=1656884 RepID=A0A967EHJ5_9MICO|nr:FtsK/SpoIIIE domain-containing protein [Metallococcus carri]NHN56463.1 FHA domain-containing protein [Metallococcus carri]NOP36087.1 FHA domain-containing protein [Calidifontibacter sp. DB2511S]